MPDHVVRAHPQQVRAFEQHLAAVSVEDPAHEVEDGGLARPIRADQGDDLSAPDAEVHVAYRAHTAEGE